MKYSLWGKAEIKYTWDIAPTVVEGRNLDDCILQLLNTINELNARKNDECPNLNWEEVKEDSDNGV